MSYAATYQSPDSFKLPAWLSVGMHVLLLGIAVISGYLSRPRASWGGPGGSVTVGLVGSVPAIPLPQPEVESPNRVVDESKGLYKSEPQPKPEPQAVPIQKFDLKKPPKYVTHPSKVLENPAPPPPNAIPYGRGGTPTVPVSTFTMAANPATQGGLIFGTNGGDFGSRFPWYVEAVQRRISGNWLQSTIDPSVAYAPRVVINFTILRDGTVTNIQITQSSNNYSVDASAKRAIENSSPLTPLPGGYSSVDVTFYFDYHR